MEDFRWMKRVRHYAAPLINISTLLRAETVVCASFRLAGWILFEGHWILWSQTGLSKQETEAERRNIPARTLYLWLLITIPGFLCCGLSRLVPSYAYVDSPFLEVLIRLTQRHPSQQCPSMNTDSLQDNGLFIWLRWRAGSQGGDISSESPESESGWKLQYEFRKYPLFNWMNVWITFGLQE